MIVIPASNLTSTPGIILTAIPPNVFFPITHVDPLEHQFDVIAIAAQVASEVAQNILLNQPLLLLLTGDNSPLPWKKWLTLPCFR